MDQAEREAVDAIFTWARKRADHEWFGFGFGRPLDANEKAIRRRHIERNEGWISDFDYHAACVCTRLQEIGFEIRSVTHAVVAAIGPEAEAHYDDVRATRRSIGGSLIDAMKPDEGDLTGAWWGVWLALGNRVRELA